MIIASQELPPIGTNTFALIEPALKECVIIDAPAEAYEWAVQVAEKHSCQIIGLILTHGHWDHILDGHKFAKAGIPTYGHADDTEMFASPSKMASYAIPGLELEELPITTGSKVAISLNFFYKNGNTSCSRALPRQCDRLHRQRKGSHCWRYYFCR